MVGLPRRPVVFTLTEDKSVQVAQRMKAKKYNVIGTYCSATEVETNNTCRYTFSLSVETDKQETTNRVQNRPIIPVIY